MAREWLGDLRHGQESAGHNVNLTEPKTSPLTSSQATAWRPASLATARSRRALRLRDQRTPIEIAPSAARSVGRGRTGSEGGRASPAPIQTPRSSGLLG